MLDAFDDEVCLDGLKTSIIEEDTTNEQKFKLLKGKEQDKRIIQTWFWGLATLLQSFLFLFSFSLFVLLFSETNLQSFEAIIGQGKGWRN